LIAGMAGADSEVATAVATSAPSPTTMRETMRARCGVGIAALASTRQSHGRSRDAR
jgi:hypothetical protein